MRVGIDFDNTIIAYDDVFQSVAKSWGLITDSVCGQKQAIRDHIRLLPDGERTWQRLQGYVYGKGISNANMFDGVGAFLSRCRLAGCPVLIVSHKTEYGHYDADRVSLREAALNWMKAHSFFGDCGYGISIENVFFEGTRAEKLARISNLDCTYFIDDLEEVLNDPAFPPGVTRILFSVNGRSSAPFEVFRSWKDIEERLFRDQ